ncbi:hypothetical protein GOP47_0013858 [Adiantum capillus-veneris]|uniref:Uncharacterized protein n=1 Tax=Adiantum capillus-veneris TaxID=13818 RepID=A0A9D4UQA4_ADICA|nr:hypothetical protein GOP47_0013858 [Adiantum capillus-veneris]
MEARCWSQCRHDATRVRCKLDEEERHVGGCMQVDDSKGERVSKGTCLFVFFCLVADAALMAEQQQALTNLGKKDRARGRGDDPAADH